jgi:methylmalonyl-CoA mutase
MSLMKMIEEKFPQQNKEDWEQSAEKALKGKSLETLSRNTYENIKLKPLYSREDLAERPLSQYPGIEDFRRGSYAAGYLGEEWEVAQKVSASSSEELAEKLLDAAAKGQTALAFQPEQLTNPEKISIAVGELYKKYPFSVDACQTHRPLIEELAKLRDSEKITGYIAADPLSIAAADKLNDRSIDELYADLNETANVAAEHMPSLKTIMVNTAVYHNGGAHAIQELAFALAGGVNHLQYFLAKGKNTEEILSKMLFNFAIGSNFFMEIAKLRAAKVLWGKVAEVYGAERDSKNMVISAETSKFTKSACDSYVNVLRAGNEAFAAVLGGVQYLHVSPYNEPEGAHTSFSDRIARNTQLILKEEAHLLKVSDPAGGSWYVEHLTNELIDKAWELFLVIENLGGMAEALQTGWVQNQVSQVFEKKQKDVHTRKQSIIGTNIYANPDEEPLVLKENMEASKSDLKPIPQVRLSESFEGLRILSKRLKEKGKQPQAGLICLGELKDHKARADFIAGFLAPGGVNAVRSDSVDNSEHAAAFMQKTNCRHYFICGSNDQYESMAAPLIRDLKEAFPSAAIYLAGLPEKGKRDEYEDAGINRYIHMKSDCYETLLTILNEMEGEK